MIGGSEISYSKLTADLPAVDGQLLYKLRGPREDGPSKLAT
jgi:hypothetical protein